MTKLNEHDVFVPVSMSYRPEDIDYSQYEKVLIAFSGGKDSVAAFLSLLKLGVPASKMEFHHHLIDGAEGSELMDWPCTESYCEAIANAFGIPIYYSWKHGGFEGEMCRENDATAPVLYEDVDKTVKVAGKSTSKLNTRRKFPQVSADLSVRWCSSYIKIMVMQKMICNEPRFQQGKYLVVTGERGSESTQRSKYAVFEPHASSAKKRKVLDSDGKETGDLLYTRHLTRHVDHLRPVHAFSEQDVWDILQEFGVNPHPAYWLGWGRTSCLTCIFGSPHQWSTIRKYMPERFSAIRDYEQEFDSTIHHKKVKKETVKVSIDEFADKGTPYECDKFWLDVAMSTDYQEDIILADWELPPGAFAESCGPT